MLGTGGSTMLVVHLVLIPFCPSPIPGVVSAPPVVRKIGVFPGPVCHARETTWFVRVGALGVGHRAFRSVGRVEGTKPEGEI